jgi:hypothetical protein
MDRVVERKKIDKRILIGAGAGAVLPLVLLFCLFVPRSDRRRSIRTASPSPKSGRAFSRFALRAR